MNPAPMTPDGTITGSLPWAFWYIGEIAFKWLPGTFMSMTGTGVPGPAVQPIDQPITAPQVVDYLQTAMAPDAYNSLYLHWSTFVALSILVSLCLGAIAIYCSIRVFQIRQLERRKVAAAQHTVAAKDVSKTQLRWHRVEELIASEEEQNWRLAILEADIMLNELLDTLGYKGETMADKMRAVDRAAFNSIDAAWEAHRIRNVVAHEGEARSLGGREARRVISLYEKVFKEFKFIE